MAFLSREFVAVPDDRKQQMVFKWPDDNLRKGTRAIIEPDQMAVFLNRGQVIGTLGPGRHAIEAQELPFLGIFIDAATGGNAYRAELFFIGTREYPGFRFGGRIDDVQDPQSGLIVTLRVFGDYSIKIADPTKLILNLTGTVDVQDNNKITGWMSEQLLKVLRTNITRQIVRNGWPILGLSAFSPEIEATVIENANAAIFDYGLTIVRMGNFDINLVEEDEARLKALAKDVSYSRLAGGFQQYAAGEAMLGAGQGMAQGGGAVQGAFLAAGMGFGQQIAAPQQAPAGPPPGPAPFTTPAVGAGAAPGGAACPSCGVANPAGAKFCTGCGGAMPAGPVHCTNCGQVVEGRFCAGCGTPRPGATVTPPPAAAIPAAPSAPPPPPAPGAALPPPPPPPAG